MGGKVGIISLQTKFGFTLPGFYNLVDWGAAEYQCEFHFNPIIFNLHHKANMGREGHQVIQN